MMACMHGGPGAAYRRVAFPGTGDDQRPGMTTAGRAGTTGARHAQDAQRRPARSLPAHVLVPEAVHGSSPLS